MWRGKGQHLLAQSCPFWIIKSVRTVPVPFLREMMNATSRMDSLLKEAAIRFLLKKPSLTQEIFVTIE